MRVSVINSLAFEAARQNPVCVTLHRVKGQGTPFFSRIGQILIARSAGKLNDAFWDKAVIRDVNFK